MDSLPAMFVANLEIEGGKCPTTASQDVLYPNPGQYVTTMSATNGKNWPKATPPETAVRLVLLPSPPATALVLALAAPLPPLRAQHMLNLPVTALLVATVLRPKLLPHLLPPKSRRLLLLTTTRRDVRPKPPSEVRPRPLSPPPLRLLAHLRRHPTWRPRLRHPPALLVPPTPRATTPLPATRALTLVSSGAIRPKASRYVTRASGLAWVVSPRVWSVGMASSPVPVVSAATFTLTSTRSVERRRRHGRGMHLTRRFLTLHFHHIQNGK